jgi:hypothetical protein
MQDEIFEADTVYGIEKAKDEFQSIIGELSLQDQVETAKELRASTVEFLAQLRKPALLKIVVADLDRFFTTTLGSDNWP